MILLLIGFILFLIWAVAFVVTVALVFLFIAVAVLAVLICGGVYEFTGRWPSAQTVTKVAGLSLTGFLMVAAPSTYVLVGGIVGTLIAARTADL